MPSLVREELLAIMTEEELRRVERGFACARMPLYQDERLGYYFARRVLADGRELVACPTGFGMAKITMGPDGQYTYDDFWDFDRPAYALDALYGWIEGDTEPVGWTRHAATKRYRPGGDPEKEVHQE